MSRISSQASSQTWSSQSYYDDCKDFNEFPIESDKEEHHDGNDNVVVDLQQALADYFRLAQAYRDNNNWR